MSTAADLPSDQSELRHRGPASKDAGPEDDALHHEGRAAEHLAADKGKKTFGRTPDGTGTLAAIVRCLLVQSAVS